MAQKIGKYEVIEELGRGAMGVVYKGKDPFIGRFVALKTITTGLQDQPELLQRFYREAQAAGGLQHPNVVTIYDLGEAQDGTPYIAMEFLEGEDLEKYIAEQRQIPLSQKINYMVQVAGALNYAHKRGVVHRDIKPANIVVTKEGIPKVLDFGIARLVDTSRSQTGLLIGTVNYMSPEQVRGERVDARSDVFSLGVMFYELVCWQRPFLGSNFTAVMLAIISQEPKPLHELAPDCPKDLSDIVHKLLRKDVNDRYQSLEEFLIDVDPVWKRLQRESVSELVAQGEKLFKAKDYAKARDLLRQAVLIDTSHTHAKTLLEKVSNEMRRSMVLPEIEGHLTKAQALMKEGRFDEAAHEAEAALKLDSMYAPAQDLLKKVQEEAGRQKTLKELLRTTKQRLAEGSLTEAEGSLNKVLEIETGKEAQELKRQLEEEKVRRETRKRLLDSMQQARNLWTQQKYDDCITILTKLQKEFPNEAEVVKLLETVREDQAEQQKHQTLAQAKAMLAEQRFADALGLLEPVLQRYKDDPAVRKLYDHIQTERKIHAQRVRLEREQNALRKLVNEEKWAEALAKGEALVKEFPDEIELARMVDYARSQQSILDHQRKLKEASNEVLKWLDKADYSKAMQAAEAALEKFPGNLELKQMLDEARAAQQEKERKEYLEKQIRSINEAMAREDQTAAIDLARQTLAVVKHDTHIDGLLRDAERKRAQRDQKRGDDQLKTVAMLLKDLKFEEASEALQAGEKTQIFSPSDPRVKELREAVKEKRAPSDAVLGGTIAAHFAPGQAQPVEASGTVAMPPSAVPAPPPAPPVAPPPPPEAPPVAPPPPEAKPPVKEEPKKEEKRKAKPAVEEPPAKKEPPKKAAPVVEAPAGGATVIFEKPKEKEKEKEKKEKPVVDVAATSILEKPREKEKKKEPAVETAPSVTTILEKPKGKPPVEEKPAVQPAARMEPAIAEPRPAPYVAEAPKKSPALLYGGIAAGVVLAAVIGWYVMSGGGTSGPTAEQKQVYEQAQQLFTQGNKEAALAKYKEYVAFGVAGAEKTAAEGRISEIETAFQNEESAWSAARTAINNKDWPTAEAKLREVISIGGKRQTEAENALETVGALKAGQDPATIERNRFQQATAEFRRGNYPRAKTLFEEVVGMSGANKAAAEQQLQVIDARIREEEVFKQGMDLRAAGKNDEAVAKFEEVIRMNGVKKTDAQTQITTIRDAAAAAAALQRFQSEAQAALAQKNFRQVRSLIQQIQAVGGDASDLTSRLNAAERQEFDALAARFEQLRRADDDTGLRSLQRELQDIANGGGSQADAARTLATNQIPAAITEITRKKEEAGRAAAAAKEAADKQKFDEAVAAFNAGQKDPGALRGNVTSLFRAIATSNSNYRAQAQDYLSNQIPTAIAAATARGCPNIVVAAASGGGLSQTYSAGENVPTNRLDEKPAWVAPCNFPDNKGLVMMSVTIDESGNVIDVRPRAPSPEFEAAAAVIRTWKASPAPKFKGQPVKTTVSVDIRPPS
jgi:serine/threonine protein kinase